MKRLNPPGTPIGLLLLAGLIWIVPSLQAARIGEIGEAVSAWEQAGRFFTLQDSVVRTALLGSLLLGLGCGLLGSFLVVRKMALLGDSLSHAVLPGVAAGFLWAGTKDPLAIFVGATLAGLLGTATVKAITSTTKIKEDSALAIVLAGFFAVGICMMTMIQRLPNGSKSGIDKFLFGQAAALGPSDVMLIAVVTLLAGLLIGLFYKEMLIAAFDSEFAASTGLPMRWLEAGFLLLLSFSIVVALQAVGVVLVSAMLIIPGATAYLLTDRLDRMLWYASGIGMLSGAAGAFFSFLGNSLPTGPFMVLSASVIFGGAFLFSPRHGVLTQWLRTGSRAARTRRENTLKAAYHLLERRDFDTQTLTLEELAEMRKETLEVALQQVRELGRQNLAQLTDRDRAFNLTPSGWVRACEVVRNHRLWELYLTNAAHLAPDHVHDDAERIEHLLGEKLVRELERRLEHPRFDPHGRPIPGLADLQRFAMPGPAGGQGGVHGYRPKH